MKYWKLGSILIMLSLSTGLSACSTTKAVLGLLKSTDSFKPLASDSRVFYKAGSENQASLIASLLPEAVAKVESAQYRPFSKPITIFICSTAKSFYSYTGYSASGCVTGKNRLFLAPRLFEQPQRISRVLTHELAHLHLEQQVGLLHFVGALPSWFEEGLAVMVSEGGGAEDVSEEMAAQAIKEGKHFYADPTGSLINKKTAHAYHLTPHMFYRQSSMFVAYLKSVDESKFRRFLIAVEDRGSLSRAIQEHYAKTLDDLFQAFIMKVKSE